MDGKKRICYCRIERCRRETRKVVAKAKAHKKVRIQISAPLPHQLVYLTNTY